MLHDLVWLLRNFFEEHRIRKTEPDCQWRQKESFKFRQHQRKMQQTFLYSVTFVPHNNTFHFPRPSYFGVFYYNFYALFYYCPVFSPNIIIMLFKICKSLKLESFCTRYLPEKSASNG